jgi:hypothetical protein
VSGREFDKVLNATTVEMQKESWNILSFWFYVELENNDLGISRGKTYISPSSIRRKKGNTFHERFLVSRQHWR